MRLIPLLVAFGSVLADESLPTPRDRPGEGGAPDVRSPRETVGEFLRRVGSGRSREAFALTTPDSDTSWSGDFPELLESDRIRPLHQLCTDDQAMVVSNPFRSRGGTESFYAFLQKREGRWQIHRSGRCRPREAVWMMKGYAAHRAVRVDALPKELVGEWWAVCDSTIIMASDGTGTELRVGPGGPVPGVKPEPFRWEVGGSTLVRRFADRREKLEIRWLDDDSVRFLRPNDSGWGGWERRD